MRVFTLALLTAHPRQIPVLTKNVTVKGEEYHPRNNGQQVIPILKGQGGQVRFITRPHPCRSPRGVHLGQRFLFPPTLPPSPPPLPILGALPTADRLPATRSARDIGRSGPMYQPPSISTRIGSTEKGTLAPGTSTTSEADAATHLVRYWIHRCDTS